MQLFEAIYRPQHFYVFHVDARKAFERQALQRMIEERFTQRQIDTQIVVLPVDRSFVTSWGSFGLVRGVNFCQCDMKLGAPFLILRKRII